ncbi:hypothetical protein PISMIDRAFT_677529, partial [Pisolithus microcarpus 441]
MASALTQANVYSSAEKSTLRGAFRALGSFPFIILTSAKYFMGSFPQFLTAAS